MLKAYLLFVGIHLLISESSNLAERFMKIIYQDALHSPIEISQIIWAYTHKKKLLKKYLNWQLPIAIEILAMVRQLISFSEVFCGSCHK